MNARRARSAPERKQGRQGPRSPRGAVRAAAVIGLALLPAAVQAPATAADAQPRTTTATTSNETATTPNAGTTRPTSATARVAAARAATARAAAAEAATTAQASAARPARTSDRAGYRYWSFWERDGKDGNGGWSYATQGPSVLRPEDGATLGFRFALSEDSKDAAKPRGSATFADVCADTKAEKGRKRIALAIDFGTRAHAPRGETPPRRRTACAQVPGDATAADALAAVAEPLRYNSDALLCAIDGYPQRGCAEQISDGNRSGRAGKEGGGAAGAASDAHGDGSFGYGPATGIAAGLAAIAALSFAAVRRSRRRG